MEKLTINKHYKVMGEWILTYDNKRFKAGSPEFKKWCKEQKLKTDKVKIKKVPQVKQKKRGMDLLKKKGKRFLFLLRNILQLLYYYLQLYRWS